MSCQAALGTPSTGERNLKIISDAQNRPHHYVGYISPATRTEFCNSLWSRYWANFARLSAWKGGCSQNGLPHWPRI